MINIINLEYDLMELIHDDKRKLFNFYNFNKNKTEIKSKKLISGLNCV